MAPTPELDDVLEALDEASGAPPSRLFGPTAVARTAIGALRRLGGTASSVGSMPAVEPVICTGEGPRLLGNEPR